MSARKRARRVATGKDPHPAWIVRLEANNEEGHRLDKEQAKKGLGPAATLAFERAELVSQAEYTDLMDKLVHTPASTPEGWLAKAYLLWKEAYIGDSVYGLPLVMGLLDDLQRESAGDPTPLAAEAYTKARLCYLDPGDLEYLAGAS